MATHPDALTHPGPDASIRRRADLVTGEGAIRSAHAQGGTQRAFTAAMAHALVLAFHVLALAREDCHLVTNHQILILPTCDLSPATVAQLTENPRRSTNTVSVGPTSMGRRDHGRTAHPLPVALSPVELQHRLETAEEERVAAISQRLVAERERDAARRDRDAAKRELKAVRRELAALRAMIARRDGAVKAEAPSASRSPRRPL